MNPLHELGGFIKTLPRPLPAGQRNVQCPITSYFAQNIFKKKQQRPNSTHFVGFLHTDQRFVLTIVYLV